jgi:hypothetical protein
MAFGILAASIVDTFFSFHLNLGDLPGLEPEKYCCENQPEMVS